MPNELDIKKQNLLNTINNNEIGDILKPLIKEIYLFDSYIAGTSHIEHQEIINCIEVGQWLNLQREDNKFDKNAILVINQDKQKLGYIPEKDNVVFARLMDAGKLLKAKVNSHETKGSFHKISIGIYLVDY